MIVIVLSALAGPTRLKAMRLLADGSEHCVCGLMQKLGATQRPMSRHMQGLHKAGLVLHRRDAQWARYRLNPDPPAPLVRLVHAALSAETVDEGGEA